MTDRDPASIKNAEARRRVEQGIQYRCEIASFLEKQPYAINTELAMTVKDLDRLIREMFRLAKSVDLAGPGEITFPDRSTLIGEIEALKSVLTTAMEARDKAQIQKSLEEKLLLMKLFESVDEGAQQASLKLDEVLGMLEKVHAIVHSLNQKLQTIRQV